ncbi:hypothetical protein AALP_AA2G114600 [Arabis alpina]|uniref:Uncharacterized protein n=1 Tax=Arabis alpina TaxID=50452 RepID=A0A087HGR7_ARAAL|nr:hypothetical protein AALP_AA2G114600 [Arabis alpina]
MARTTRERGRGGRGRGRGPVDESVLSEAQSSTRGAATVQQTLHDGQTANVTASVGTGLGPVGAGLDPVEAGGVGAARGAGVAAGVAQAGDDRLVDLLRQLLERLLGAVPVQAPVFPRVAEVQPRAAVAHEVPLFIRMMGRCRGSVQVLLQEVEDEVRAEFSLDQVSRGIHG